MVKLAILADKGWSLDIPELGAHGMQLQLGSSLDSVQKLVKNGECVIHMGDGIHTHLTFDEFDHLVLHIRFTDHLIIQTQVRSTEPLRNALCLELLAAMEHNTRQEAIRNGITRLQSLLRERVDHGEILAQLEKLIEFLPTPIVEIHKKLEEIKKYQAWIQELTLSLEELTMCQVRSNQNRSNIENAKKWIYNILSDILLLLISTADRFDSECG